MPARRDPARHQRVVTQGRRGDRTATSRTCRSTPMQEVEEMLRIVQSLDPPGVGARDLRECLMLQLREAGLEQSVPYRLVRDCFEELINHRWSEISKRFGISPATCRRPPTRSRSSIRSRDSIYSDAERQLHHPRSHRRQDRRQVSRLPQRREPPAPQAEHAPTRRSRATRRSSTARTRSSSPTS